MSGSAWVTYELRDRSFRVACVSAATAASLRQGAILVAPALRDRNAGVGQYLKPLLRAASSGCGRRLKAR